MVETDIITGIAESPIVRAALSSDNVYRNLQKWRYL